MERKVRRQWSDGVISTGWLVFGTVLVVVGAARVIELWHAKKTRQAANQRGEDARKEPVFFWMVVLHTLPFVLGPLEVLLVKPAFSAPIAGISIAALVVAAVLRVWTLRTLGKSWNVRIIKPDTVVTEGPYAFIRHPNYLVVIIELFFIPLVHSAFITCAALTLGNAWVLSRRIPEEEKVLFEVPGYRDAMGGKNRFLPFPKRA